jgi:hypothetical protein
MASGTWVQWGFEVAHRRVVRAPSTVQAMEEDKWELLALAVFSDTCSALLWI